MKPDAEKKYNPDPEYLKKLLKRSGLTQNEASRRLGIPERLLRRYLQNPCSATYVKARYVVQFCLEALSKK